MEAQSVEGVYRGHLTKLFTKLHLSTPYYSMVTKQLKAMGCIEQLRRGGGGAESEWQLIAAPTEDLYDAHPKETREGVRSTVPAAAIEQQIRDLANQVNELRTRMDAYEEAS
jgi:hypothetical protein